MVTAMTMVATPTMSRRGRAAVSAMSAACPAAPPPVAVVRLSALGRWLRRVPITPTSIGTLLGGLDDYIEFRRIVRAVFPGAEAEILDVTPSDGADLETERCWAFMHKVEERFFPVYELESYEQVACGVPFVRFGWSYDRLHDLDKRPGELLLFVLCEQPYADGFDSRIPLLEAVAALLPHELVADIPRAGIHPDEHHKRLDDTPYAAAAEYCDWLWCQTNTAFLDIDDEIEVVDDEWSRAYVLVNPRS